MLEVVAQILKFNEKSPITGVVYRKEEMEKIVEKFNKDGTKYGQFAEGDEPFSKENMSHKVINLKIVEDKVVADIEFIETPKGFMYQDLIKRGEKFAAAPRIEVDENGNLVDVVSVDIIKEEKSVFNGNTLEIVKRNGFKERK